VVTGIFVALGVYLTYSVLNLNVKQLHVATTIQAVDRGWLNLNKELVRLERNCPNLIESFIFPWQKNIIAPHHDSVSNKQDDLMASFYIAAMIFQSWEDFFTTTTLDDTESGAWIGSFLVYARSPILGKIWLAQRSSYASKTQQFGNLLIHYVSTYNPKSEKELNELVTRIVRDPEYQKMTNEK
jgi:hypothetical protein